MTEVVATDILRSIVERIERLEEEKRNLQLNIKEVYAEAEGNGFEKKIIRKVVKLRAMDAAKRQEEESITDLYKRALGM